MDYSGFYIARRRELCAALISTAIAAINPTALSAATATAAMPVSATVLSVCAVVATPMLFGNYNGGSGSPTDAQATLLVVCTPLEDYDIALNKGLDASATVADRWMAFAGNQLHYNLYTSSDRSTIWGDGTLGTDIVSGDGDGLIATIDVFGRIPEDQFPPPGLYVDVVTVTMTY